MKSYILALTILACSVAAQSIDNSAAVSDLAESLAAFDGSYYVQNVETGDYMTMVRNDLVDVTTSSSPATVTLQTVTAADYTGTVISGSGKCCSSQWGTHSDVNFVAYACRLGSGATTDLEIVLAKQQYAFQPVPCPGSSDDTATSDDVELAAVVKATSSSSSAAPAATSSASSSSSSSDSGPCPGINYTGPSGVTADHCTWICQHPAVWLAAHSGYVYEGGHVECYNTLQAYLASQRRMSKREVRHHDLAKRLVKRDTCYSIVPFDHLADMATRAVSGVTVDAAGGYLGLSIVAQDTTDPSQLWRVSSS